MLHPYVKVADTQDMSVGVGDAVDASVTLAGGLAVRRCRLNTST